MDITLDGKPGRATLQCNGDDLILLMLHQFGMILLTNV
jgi:hypothetical protein